MRTLAESHAPPLAQALALLVDRLGCDSIVAVGKLAAGLRDALPGTLVLDSDGAVHPGNGPQAIRDLLPGFSRDTLFVLGSNLLDPAYVARCLYELPRGVGALLIALGEINGPASPASLADQLLLWDPHRRLDLLQLAGRSWLLVQPRRRVHVTLLMERYSHTYGASGPSINWDNLVASLAQTGLATSSTVLYDERHHEGRPYTAADFRRPDGVDDHVIVCIYDVANQYNPAPELLREAQADGSRIAYLWLDSRILPHDPVYPELADLNIVLDASEYDLPNAWPAFTPKNPAFFRDPGRDDPTWERPIDVSLLGEMRFLAQRKDLLPRLQAERRLSIHAPGSSATDTGRRLSTEEYARVYQQSKISIVLTKDRVRQLKGRIFEVPLCGALLLSDVNPYVDRFFEPFREYVPFTDYEDMIALCRHYVAHDDERRAIAAAGSAKANRCYTAQVFWGALFARLFDGDRG